MGIEKLTKFKSPLEHEDSIVSSKDDGVLISSSLQASSLSSTMLVALLSQLLHVNIPCECILSLLSTTCSCSCSCPLCFAFFLFFFSFSLIFFLSRFFSSSCFSSSSSSRSSFCIIQNLHF